KYFTPYDSPYEAFINYMNVLSDFVARVDEKYDNKEKKAVKSSVPVEAPVKKTVVPKASAEKNMKEGKKAVSRTRKK
ncbi:MAG: alpha-amylase, partial [Odoribacter sp.]|nr:alpha-amylase [Odoribacter sp.]